MSKVRNLTWGVPIFVFLGLGFLMVLTGADITKSDEGQSMGMMSSQMKVTIEGKNISLGWLSKIGPGQRDGGQRRWHMKGKGYGTSDQDDISYAKIRITNIAQSVPLSDNTCGEDDGCGDDGDTDKSDQLTGPKVALNPAAGDMDVTRRDGGVGEPARGQEHNALRVSRILDENGKEMMGMEGMLLFYLDTDKSRPLITGHRGQWINVTGKLFSKERIIDVDSFKLSSVAYRPMVRMTLEGKNINLCQMLKQEGATGSCERYPQTALQITRVITTEPLRHTEEMEGTMEEESRETPQEEAKERGTGQTVGVPDMTGWVLHYARTDKATDLLRANQDRMVQVSGTVFPYRRLIIVDSFKSIAGSEEKK